MHELRPLRDSDMPKILVRNKFEAESHVGCCISIFQTSKNFIIFVLIFKCQFSSE